MNPGVASPEEALRGVWYDEHLEVEFIE